MSDYEPRVVELKSPNLVVKEFVPKQLGGIKHDQGKPRMSLLPPAALQEVLKVLEFGAKKYGDHQWRSGFIWTRLYDAAMRHELAWLNREKLDPESKIHHLAHAVTNLLFLLEHELKSFGKDDRP